MRSLEKPKKTPCKRMLLFWFFFGAAKNEQNLSLAIFLRTFRKKFIIRLLVGC